MPIIKKNKWPKLINHNVHQYEKGKAPKDKERKKEMIDVLWRKRGEMRIATRYDYKRRRRRGKKRVFR